ncbi:MAG: lycopene cyclase domain-containing protein [archaeon]
MFEYSYFIGCLVMGIIWTAFFIIKQNLRKQMLLISFLCAIAGFLSAFFYNSDWWRPLTITHTYIGIEDFMFGFFLSGIAAASAHIFAKVEANKKYFSYNRFFIIVVYAYLSTWLLMSAGLHSFFAAGITASVLLAIMIFSNSKLTKPAIYSGIFTMIFLIPAYVIPSLLNPGWFSKDWLINNLIGITVFGLPIEDIIWVIIGGANLGIIYDFCSKEN